MELDLLCNVATWVNPVVVNIQPDIRAANRPLGVLVRTFEQWGKNDLRRHKSGLWLKKKEYNKGEKIKKQPRKA